MHSFYIFFFNDTATTEIYTLSLHDALPISRRDALEERLQGHRHHTRANACDPSFTALTSSLYAGARVCCYSAPRFGDAVAALGGRAVGGRADTDLQALGKR